MTTPDPPSSKYKLPDGTWRDIKEIIQDERERAGLSKQQAADLAGVRRELWRKWEHGDAIPCRTSLEKISKTLRVPLKILLQAAKATSDRRQLRRLQEDMP